MGYQLRQGTEAVVQFGPFKSKDDFLTYLTGMQAAIDGASGILISKNGAELALRHQPVTPSVYDAMGYYRVTLGIDDVDTVGTLLISYDDPATCLPVSLRCEVLSKDEYDIAVDGSVLVSWALAKMMLDIPDSEQVKIQMLINAITAQAQQIAGRRFAQARDIIYRDGPGRSKLIMPDPPIIVHDIWVDPTRAFPASTLMDPSLYAVLADEGMVELLSSVWPYGVQNVKLDYTHGYSSISEDLQLAAIECIAWNRKRIAGEGIGLRSITSPDGINTGFELTIPLSAQKVFASYRIY